MNAKKVGLITAGVVATVLAVSPLAWAAEPTVAPENCSFAQAGEDVVSSGEVGPQAPNTANNEGVFGECSTFGQNNDQNNGVGNTFNGQPIPELPSLS